MPVADAQGSIAFEIEAICTKGVNEHYNYIKSSDLDDFNSWKCVTANFKLGVSKHTVAEQILLMIGNGLMRYVPSEQLSRARHCLCSCVENTLLKHI